MFARRKTRNLAEAAFTTLALIYHQTVHNLRKTHSNAVIGLLMAILQTMIMVLGFFAIYWVVGIKRSPLRGDFMLFLMSGIFIFMVHVQAAGAVSGAGSATSAMMKHGPMNTAIAITAAALAALYTRVVAIIVILWFYHVLGNPVVVENWRGCMAMLLLAWFSGSCIGLVFLSIRQWWPSAGNIITQLFQRINMVASGKMFVANMLPGFMLAMFDWNPLFHIIDQTRGFLFINYTPHYSSISYPVWVTLAILMIGLMAEFVTRNAASLSWTAGR